MKLFILSLCVLALAIAAQAQNHTLSGVIRSARTLAPLAGAHVWAEGVLDTAVSNANGVYSLTLHDGSFTVHFGRLYFCDFVRPVLIGGSNVQLAVELSDPHFECDITSISAQWWPGHVTVVPFQIGNETGNCPLNFMITDTSAWVAADPDLGSIAPGAVQEIDVIFYDSLIADTLADYNTVLRVVHNATNGLYTIPVTLARWLGTSRGAVSPEQFTLLAAYPNPFNPATTIAFSLAHETRVELTVSDISGRKVASLANGLFAAGEHSVTFDGAKLPSGIYFATLSAGNVRRTQKLVLLK